MDYYEDETKDRGCCCSCIHFIIRTIIILTLLAGLVAMFIYFDEIKSRIDTFIMWVTHHQYQGPLMIVGVFVICELIFIPSTIITVGAGFALTQGYDSQIKAMIVGVPACYAGSAIAAVLSFILGRYVFQECARKMSRQYPTLYAFDRAIKDQGVVLIFLLRLCPLIPFSMMNFCFGITSLTWCSFMFSLIAIAPSIILYVWIGTGIQQIADVIERGGTINKHDKILLYSMVGGTFLGLVGVCYISCVANQYLKQALEQTEREMANDREDRENLLERHNDEIQEESGPRRKGLKA